MPENMRGWIGDGKGGLSLAEVPVPVPAPDHALVRNRATTLSRGMVRYLPQMPAGRVLGVASAGVVEKQATDGSGPPEGSRVVVMTGYSGGGMGEFVATPAINLGVIPDSVSWADAVFIPGNALTAFYSVSRGDFLVGKRVLITGVNGNVGRIAAQLAQIAGAKVTGSVSRPERKAAAEPLGLDAIGLNDEVEGPFDLIVETVGGGVLAHALKVAARDGVVVTIGGGDGFDAPPEPAIVPNGWFFDHPGARLVSENVAERIVNRTGVARNLAIIGELVGEGRLDLAVEEQADWKDIGKVVDRVKGGDPLPRIGFLMD